MQISTQIEIKKVSRFIAGVHKKQIPFAAAQALNDTAAQARLEAMDKMARYIDRPTPWTKKGIIYKRANKRTLFAEVVILDNRWKYLKHQVQGGVRHPANRAIAVPVEQKRNQYGNMTRGAVNKLLANPNVFSGVVAGHAGIFKRMGGKRNPRLKMLVRWIPVAEYQARFPYHSIVRKSVQKTFTRNFSRRLTAAIRTAR